MDPAQDDNNAKLAQAMAQPGAVQHLAQLASAPPAASTPSGRPEVAEGKAGLGAEAGKETAEIEIIPEFPEISPELAEHIEVVQRGEVQLPGPIDVGTYAGAPVSVQPAAPQPPNLILPVTKADFVAGQKQPISSSWHWLYEWVKRIILMKPGRTVYRPE